MTARITLALTVLAVAIFAQASRSVWDGVYTDAQAKRGEALFGEVRHLSWPSPGG